MAEITEETLLMQRAFRCVMRACSRPGLVGRIGAFDAQSALDPYFETLTRLVVDQAVSFSCVGDEACRVASYLKLQTHSSEAAPDRADFVLVPETESACTQQVISQACGGTLVAPERGASVIVALRALGGRPLPGESEPEQDDDACHRIVVSGPGVDGEETFMASDIAWALARAARADEYPCGIDVYLVDAKGRVVVVPRTTRIESIDGKETGSWDM